MFGWRIDDEMRNNEKSDLPLLLAIIGVLLIPIVIVYVCTLTNKQIDAEIQGCTDRGGSWGVVSQEILPIGRGGLQAVSVYGCTKSQ